MAAADKRPGDVPAALEYAAELARRTEEGNAFWMGFGPVNVGLWRMAGALELGDHERAVATAEGLRPGAHPNLSRRAAYGVDYGRALARLWGRHDDAVLALRRAETISPLHLHRNPLARDVLAMLVVRSRRDAIGRELRGDGLPGGSAGVAPPGSVQPVGHRLLPTALRSSIGTDIREIPDPQGEPCGVGVAGKRADDEHPAWCSPEHCFVTDEGVRVHPQAPTCWEDDTAEVRCELAPPILVTDPTTADRDHKLRRPY